MKRVKTSSKIQPTIGSNISVRRNKNQSLDMTDLVSHKKTNCNARPSSREPINGYCQSK